MQRRLALALMLLATEAVYIPWFVLRGAATLYGWDYMFLHARRLAFARDALLGARHQLPGWYPREMLGTPFAANLQDFPWIPTHLPLLLFDPYKAYAAGIAIAAALAALFTYLFCRRMRLSPTAAAAAGWTFACAGCLASQVMVGHLVNLEAYPALPLLLWLADRAVDSGRRGDMLALALGTACVVLAGHPQIPAYAVAIAMLYVLWRGRGWARAKLCGAMALGIGATMVAWWPMLLLIRRSSRMLPLDRAANDVTLPYHRLLALIAPGIDGWPAGVNSAAHHVFSGYAPYFWDTFGYVGLLPLVAVLALCCLRNRKLADSRWRFLAIIGAAALIGALPLLDPLRDALHATLLRSPARLLYVCTLSLAVAFGIGIDALLRYKRFGYLAVAGLLAFHAWDLGHISRRFITPGPLHPLEAPELAGELGNSRVATSRVVDLKLDYYYNDAGGFDAIFLADTYRPLLALIGAPPQSNEEVLDASTWSVAALQAAGVGYVIPWPARKDLELVKSAAGLYLYRVPNPAPLAFSRPDSDHIVAETYLLQPGLVHILESYDPGWTATVDGAPTPVQRATPLGMDISVPAGDHTVRLSYHTVGRETGAVLSLISMVLLGGLLAMKL